MKKYDVCGVKVTSDLEDFTFDDAVKYVDYILNSVPPAVLATNPLEKVTVTETADGKVDVNYTLHGEGFERIRRITG